LFRCVSYEFWQSKMDNQGQQQLFFHLKFNILIMKTTFTLTAFIVLVILIACGNISEASNIEKTWKSRFEKNFKGLNLKVTQDWQGHKNHKKRISSKDFSLKSAQAIKQRLDSYSDQEWDEFTSQWIPGDKVEFIYDTNGNVTQDLEYTWDESINQWFNVWKSEYTYDAKGNLSQELYFGLNDTTMQFIGIEKNTYTYDANGNQTQQLNFEYDLATGLFVAYRKSDYTYDANGNISQEIDSYLDETTLQFVGMYKDDYKYNGSGKEAQKVTSYYDETSSKWMQMFKNESTYDSKGNLTLTLESGWDGISSWYDSAKDEYSYDTNGDLTQHLRFSMDNSQWVGLEKNTYSYDDKGNMAQEIDYSNWNDQTKQWDDIWKDDYTFDNNYTFNDLILPFGDVEDFFTHMLTGLNEYKWNINTNDWASDYKMTFVYSAQNITSVRPLNSELSSIYPNPCSESVSVSFPTSNSQISFELFDLQGRMLIQKEISNHEKVSMEGLGSGMYLYKLNVDGKMQSGKLVKE